MKASMSGRGSAAAGPRLVSAASSEFQPLGAFGKPVWQSHAQLRAMLLGRAGPRVANYFSRPAVEGDGGTISWISEVQGEVRTWEQLPQEERASRAMDLEAIRSDLLRMTHELRASGGSTPGGAGGYASLLEQAVKVPAKGEHLRFVGEQPVIAFWGFADDSGAVVEPAARAPDYARLGMASAAPAAAPPVEPVQSQPVPPPSLPLPDPAPPAAEQSRHARWWWLLAALLLLALLLLGLRSCQYPFAKGLLGPVPQAATENSPRPSMDARLREAGASAGETQVSIAWNSSNDVDLRVTVRNPKDGTVLSHLSYEAKRDRFDGRLDVDRNRGGEELTNTPVENIFWPGGKAPNGLYEVLVHHFETHGGPDPVTVQVRVRNNGQDQLFEVELKAEEAKIVSTFERKGR